MATPAPRFTRLEHDERRAQILTAARTLFSEHPYSAVSTTAIAREAGVARGLLNHYFGTKRELYVAVVRSMVRVPPPPVPEDVEGRPLADLAGESIDAWLDAVRRNRETWFAAIGGFGHDPEVDAIVEEAREQAVERLAVIVALGSGDAVTPGRRLLGVLRAYGGLAETATQEWLVRRRLSREQTHQLLVSTLLHLVKESTT